MYRKVSDRARDAGAIEVERRACRARGCPRENPSPCRRSGHENPRGAADTARPAPARRGRRDGAGCPHKAPRSRRARPRARRFFALPRGVVIGDVVDLAAERIDRVHAVAPVLRQQPHRPVERGRRPPRPVRGSFRAARVVGLIGGARASACRSSPQAADDAGQRTRRRNPICVNLTRLANGSPRRNRASQPPRQFDDDRRIPSAARAP